MSVYVCFLFIMKTNNYIYETTTFDNLMTTKNKKKIIMGFCLCQFENEIMKEEKNLR